MTRSQGIIIKLVFLSFSPLPWFPYNLDASTRNTLVFTSEECSALESVISRHQVSEDVYELSGSVRFLLLNVNSSYKLMNENHAV